MKNKTESSVFGLWCGALGSKASKSLRVPWYTTFGLPASSTTLEFPNHSGNLGHVLIGSTKPLSSAISAFTGSGTGISLTAWCPANPATPRPNKASVTYFVASSFFPSLNAFSASCSLLYDPLKACTEKSALSIFD